MPYLGSLPVSAGRLTRASAADSAIQGCADYNGIKFTSLLLQCGNCQWGGSSMIRTTLSHYRILEKLGAGGMAEVFCAHDATLYRQVAICSLLPVAAVRAQA